MQAYQQMLDVTGNNIANADTVAFKEDRVNFADMFSRTLSRGSGATATVGGTNPIQVGLGVKVASVDKNMSQGGFTSTQKDFDVALDGEGFFVVNDGVNDIYTRSGAFDVDSQGYLVDPATGYRLQRIGTTGELNGFQQTGNTSIEIPYQTNLPGSPTATVNFKGNLSASDNTPTTTEVQASGMAYTLTGGGLADASTDFSSIDQLQAFAPGDTIAISGRARDGTPATGTFTYGAANDGTTLQDLLNVITTTLGGPAQAVASIENGKITLRDANAGYSLMDLGLSSSAHPTGVPGEFDYLSVGGAAAQTTNINVFDRQSRSHSLTATFVRQAQNSNVWDLVINGTSDATAIADRRIVGIAFDENGTYQGTTGTDGFGHSASDPNFTEWDSKVSLQFPGIVTQQDISGDFGRRGFYDGLTQVGGASSAGAVNQDGYGTGSLQSVSIDGAGVISGTFSNGQTLPIAALKIAVFDNAQGLERAGANYYRPTPAAGSVVYSEGLQGRAGRLRQHVLEDSNVDIAGEFTRLITAQEGFQVNSRVVRVTNNILQQLASIIV
jgi:flagellar hook protein FlgE